MTSSFAEAHKKTVPGSLFGVAGSSLTLAFTKAPDIPPDHAGLISVDPLTGATMSPRLLSSGKSCLDVSLTDLFVSLDPARLEEAREFASTPQSAAHIVLLSHFAELAQSIGQTFFTSAKDLHPTLTYEAVAREDGKYQLQNARMIMKGVANKHPFWSPGGNY